MFDLAFRNRVAVLTLSRPPVNAISAAWMAGLHDLLDGLESRDDWSVLHIRSDQKAFCAGADLAEIEGRFGQPDAADAVAENARAFQILFERIEKLPQVTLAEIGGAAVGGGLELALACDLRIAASEATMGLPEARLGLLPAGGGTQRLTRLCGGAAAARIILACEVVDGATARNLGLVQWSVPASEIAAAAQALAERVAALPEAALGASKACIAAARDGTGDGFAIEIEATRILAATPETRALVTAFIESRSKQTVEEP